MSSVAPTLLLDRAYGCMCEEAHTCDDAASHRAPPWRMLHLRCAAAVPHARLQYNASCHIHPIQVGLEPLQTAQALYRPHGPVATPGGSHARESSAVAGDGSLESGQLVGQAFEDALNCSVAGGCRGGTSVDSWLVSHGADQGQARGFEGGVVTQHQQGSG